MMPKVTRRTLAASIWIISVLGIPMTSPGNEDADSARVSELDREFQAAVKRNDTRVMAQILHPRMTLVLGDGRVETREDLLREAEARVYVYELQEEDPSTQSVRIFGDTAVVTARLRIKGTREGVGFDRTLWFSDTYVRTPQGWRYFFGQASLPVPRP